MISASQPIPQAMHRWLRHATAAALLPALALSLASGETYYHMSDTGNWNTPADWKLTSDSGAPSPSSVSSADDFVAARKAARLRSGSGATTFGGASLTLGATHYLGVGGGTSVQTLPVLITRDTPSIRGGNTTSNLVINDATVQSGTLDLRNHTHANATFNLSIDSLNGSGDVTSSRPGTFSSTAFNKLTLADATSFQGTFTVTTTHTEFMGPVSFGGTLSVPTPGNLTVNHPVVALGLVVNDVTYGPGNYTAGALGFAGTASTPVTVRLPATWYLAANQTSGQDWTQAYASQWKANANGSGASAPSINIVDTYAHNVGTNTLRTPTGTSTFRGGVLQLGGSAKLALLGGSSAISTVPQFTTTGGTIDAGTGTRHLASDKLSPASGTTTIAVGSGGVLNLHVQHLTGAGNLALAGSGELRPHVDHGNHYTGTFTVNSGSTLRVQTRFGTAGSLVVTTGGSVVLDDWVYVTGLTANGQSRPLGTYTASQLGSGFSGSGRIVVYTRDLAGPPQMFGVNLAGAEFNSGTYWPTDPATWDYYQSKGLTLIRLPFKWRRIQSTLNGPVNFTKLDECVELARARGMKVILDMHDYSKYGSNSGDPLIGQPGLPVSAFVDVWSKIADHYNGDPVIYGYDLMNEPKGGLALWADAAQHAVDGIRKHDQTAYVLVEGMNSSSATDWVQASGALDIQDPVGRLIYSAHTYWDSKQSTLPDGTQNWGSDGIYISNEPRDPDRGIVQTQPFIDWLQTRPYAHGNFGEYGIPNNYNVADWNLVLRNFLQHLRDNNISGTYWAGGSWPTYQLLSEPRPLVGGADPAVMLTLQDFNNNSASWSNQDINASPAGSAMISGANATISGAGGDIFGSADAFHFAYQPLTGDGSITVRAVSVQNTNNWAKAGPMIRESLAPGARNIMVRRTPGSNGTTAQWRATANASSSSTGSGGTSMPWMRLTRVGDTFTASRSTDGVTWSTLTTQTIAMPSQVYIGLAVTSHSTGTLCEAVFDNLSVNDQ